MIWDNVGLTLQSDRLQCLPVTFQSEGLATPVTKQSFHRVNPSERFKWHQRQTEYSSSVFVCVCPSAWMQCVCVVCVWVCVCGCVVFVCMDLYCGYVCVCGCLYVPACVSVACDCLRVCARCVCVCPLTLHSMSSSCSRPTTVYPVPLCRLEDGSTQILFVYIIYGSIGTS